MRIYPFSNEIIEELEFALSDFDLGKSVIRFDVDNVTAKEHLELIIDLRLEQLK